MIPALRRGALKEAVLFNSGDTYDANGNTTSSGGIPNSYDFENHLVQQGGATIVYDGDGNRATKTVGSVTTIYVTASVNPTGYAQVVGENFSGPGTDTARTFVYGLDRISQRRQFVANHQNQTQVSYYLYDGHGSTRALADTTGNVTDTNDYDAFGNLIHTTGTTPNEFLFAGEQYDSDLHLYYNRARYLNVTTGRFWTMDTHEGDDNDPISLHKYLYAQVDPIDNTDHSGSEIDEVIGSFGVAQTLNALPVFQYDSFVHQYRTASTISVRGLEFIKLQEGLKTLPYNDLGENEGNCTIGYGHLIHFGVCTQVDSAQYPNGISPDTAEQLLFQDVYEKAVIPIKFLVAVPLAQREFDALADFTFNIGAGNSLPSLQAGRGLASTMLLRVLNLGFYGAVPAEFRKFRLSGGIVIPGLVRRRDDEANLWITGIYRSNGTFIP